MATNKNNVVGLAKGTTKKTTTRRKPATKAASTSSTKTATEKAKQVVEDLVSDVNLNPPQVKESFELVTEETVPQTPEGNKNKNWLEEQVSILTETNEKLNKEVQELRARGTSSTDAGVLRLFNEFNTEYLKHPVTTRKHTSIFLNALMSKMLKEFPFLAKK